MTNEAKKKFSCCPEIGRVKFFLSLTRLHKSHTQTEKFSLANLNVRIYVFFISNNKIYFSLKDISEADKQKEISNLKSKKAGTFGNIPTKVKESTEICT